jgi:Ca2+-binding RTX toxin-like protein
LTGDGVITNGKLDFKEALVDDIIKNSKSLSVSVYSDSSYQNQIGTTATTQIQDCINLDIGSTITTSSSTTTLAVTISRLTLTGGGNINGTGNALNNYLIGNDGNNILDGGAGNDILAGGKGNDTYIVDSIYDRVIEHVNEGIDTIKSSVNWTLGLNLENLILTGTDNLTGTGNSLDNVVTGNSGNNVLDGMGGTDILTGGAGADTFLFSTRPVFGASTADHITDFKGSEGDRLQISKSAFGLASDATATLTTVSSATELSTALGSATTFVYDSSNGNLYWNQNGIKSGFGSGGIFAVLDNHSALSASNISLV